MVKAVICLLFGLLVGGSLPAQADGWMAVSKGARSGSISPQTISDAGLPPQSLAPNECGLFLWSATDTTQFVFFLRAATPKALFLIDGTPTPIVKVSEQGEIFGQFFTDLTFQTKDGNPVVLTYAPGESLKGGARISDGLIEFVNQDGWRVAQPVLGVRVCQPVIPAGSPGAQRQ